jgi:DNA-directed RNA polymerase subunit RPC12/RpoP
MPSEWRINKCRLENRCWACWARRESPEMKDKENYRSIRCGSCKRRIGLIKEG